MAILPALPLEKRQQIAAQVQTVHRPSLCEFSLASKACYAASTFLIYQEIKITVSNQERLQRDVEKFLGALSQLTSIHHVR